MRENGVYRGGTGVMQAVFYSTGGAKIIPQANAVTLKVYRPDNTLFQTYDSVNVEPDGTVWVKVSIPENEKTGVWVCEWLYVEDGNTFKTEVPFLVSDPVYR